MPTIETDTLQSRPLPKNQMKNTNPLAWRSPLRQFSLLGLVAAAALTVLTPSAEAGIWAPKENKGIGGINWGKSNAAKGPLVVKNTKRGYQADIHVAQGHVPTIKIGDMGWRNKWVRAKSARGGANTKNEVMWWSGVKSPVNASKVYDNRILNEFYIVTDARGGYNGMVDWIKGANKGWQVGGGTLNVGKWKFPTFRRTDVYKTKNGVRYNQQFTWVLAFGWENVPADQIIKAARDRGWVKNQWYCQQWHRFIELFHDRGSRTIWGDQWYWFN